MRQLRRNEIGTASSARIAAMAESAVAAEQRLTLVGLRAQRDWNEKN